MNRRSIDVALRLLQALAATALLLSLAVAVGAPGRAFIQNHTDNPTPGAGPVLLWNTASLPISFRFHSTPPTGIADSRAWYAALKRSLRAWIELPTSDLTAIFTGSTTVTSWASSDGNIVFPLNTGWDGGAGVLALTRVDFVLATGQLTDADLKFNGESFTWTDSYGAERAAVGGDTAFDLESVASHEFGHAWGFGHSLDNTGVNPGDADYDDNGTVGNLTDDQINDANQNTMDPVSVAGETFQRTLAADDSSAMVASYPTAGTALATPAVFLTEPNDIGDAPAGGSYNIQWLSQYDGPANPTVAFYYTTNPIFSAAAALSGATLIAAGVASPKDGSLSSYTWKFNHVPAGSYHLIAVVVADGKTSYDVSPGRVTVAPATLTLTAPTAAGITLTPYTDYSVTWTQGGSARGKLKIEMSKDNGIGFPLLVANTVDPTTGTHTFTVPDPQAAFMTPGPLTQCKIRISYVDDSTVLAISANPFTLAADSNSLTIVSPNGGENFAAGSNANITFNASGTDVGSDFQLFWSDDGGVTWAPITPGLTIPGPNPRTFVWPVPAQPGSNNRIQIFSLNRSLYFDLSDSPFTISPAAARTFSAFPAQMVFDAVIGGGNPPSLPLYMRNAGVNVLTNCAVAVTGDPSVSVTPNSGITVGPAPDLATLTVAVNNAFVSPGTVTANLVFTTAAANATNENYTIPVTVRVHAAGSTAALTYTPATLTFVGDPFALPPAAQTTTVANPNLNVDTLVDAFPNNIDVILKPGRFSLAAGDAVPGGADEQVLTVIGDTSVLNPGQTVTAQIVTQATNIGNGSIAVTLSATGTAAGGKKKSGCAVNAALHGPAAAQLEWLLLLCLGGLGCRLTRRRA